VSLDADKCCVKALLYTATSDGVDDYVLTAFARQLGWEVHRAPELSSYGVPYVKSLYMDAAERLPNCSYYAYSNGDILYSHDIVETLEEVSKVSRMNAKSNLIDIGYFYIRQGYTVFTFVCLCVPVCEHSVPLV